MSEHADWRARLECERWRTSTDDPAAAIDELKLRESPAYAKPYTALTPNPRPGVRPRRRTTA